MKTNLIALKKIITSYSYFGFTNMGQLCTVSELHSLYESRKFQTLYIKVIFLQFDNASDVSPISRLILTSLKLKSKL